MKIIKELKWNALLKSVLYILLGVVALFFPQTMGRTMGYLVGIVLIIAGAVSMVAYLLRQPEENYYRNDFAHGLIGVAVGIIVLYKVDFIVSLLPLVLGVMVLVSGCTKLQNVIDMKRMNQDNWIAILIVAVINVVFGVVLICNPFDALTMLIRFIGAGLVFSGLSDGFLVVYLAKKINEFVKGTQSMEATYEEVKE